MACDDAMARFHNSKFRGTRLVCRPRPRKGAATAEASGDEAPSDAATGTTEAESISPKAPPTGPAGASAPRPNARIRYFILKSLTVEDLEMSVKNGVWATQSHNEETLNQAFEVPTPSLTGPVALSYNSALKPPSLRISLTYLFV